MQADEQVLRSHIEQGPFQSGADRGYWRLITIDWPYVLMGIRAAEREQGASEYVFRFECSDYPQTATTAQLWNVEGNGPLNSRRWPTGQNRVQLAFNPDWKNGQCLYLPCDRLSIEGHGGWINQHPSMIWSPASNITQYLRLIYDLLNSEDYTGYRCP